MTPFWAILQGKVPFYRENKVFFGTGPYDREDSRNLARTRVNSALEIDFAHQISILDGLLGTFGKKEVKIDHIRAFLGFK